MPRSFCIPGIVFLFTAFVLLFLTSLSLPFIPTMDIVRVDTTNGGQILGQTFSEARLGIWAYCYTNTVGDNGATARTCGPTGHAYNLAFENHDRTAEVTIGQNWTRGLAAIPVALVATFVAFLLSFSMHLTVTLISSLMSFFAALLTFICFLIEIALYAFVHHEIGQTPGFDGAVHPGPGFWLTFVSLILLLLAGCTVCFGRRKDKAGDSYPSYPMSTTQKSGFLSRFKRN